MRTRMLILTAFFAVLTAVGAFIRIPTPVSNFSLQVLFTCMAGLLLGPRWGAASQAVYVGLGLLGLPVFTLGGGLSYVLQPTFGFLLGLIPAAWLVGHLTRSRRDFKHLFPACLAGTAMVYLLGLPWMHGILTLHMDLEITFGQTLVWGMLVFIPEDIAKAALSAYLASKLLPRLRR